MADRPDETSGPGAEQAYREEIRHHLRRNYGAHLAHGLLGQTGFRLIQAPTFLPAYVESLAGPVGVGIARACQSLGMFVSPVLGATFIEHRRRVLPVGLVVGGLMRLQVLGLAVSGFLLSGSQALAATFVFLGLFGFFMGMQGVIFSFLISKLIPVEFRGRLMGLRNALAGVTAAAVGVVGGQLVETNLFGNGFAATFGLAFVLTSLGLAMLLLLREPAPPFMRPPSRVGQRLRELPALLRSDPAFTRYFLARALGTLGRMAQPFYVLYAATRFPVGGLELGQLTMAFVLAQSVTNLVWGTIADRRGFRAVFISSLGLWTLATLVLLTQLSFAVLLAVMTGLGAGVGGFMMSSQNLVLEFGSRKNLPMRIAVANSASELMGALGPLVGGLLVALWSYHAVFWAAVGFQAAAMLWVLWAVPEPRRRSARAGSSRRTRGEG